MSLDKELSGIARFNGDEFHIWKWQMKSLLQYKKIHTIVNGTETLADAEDKEDWQAREYFAFTLLCNSVERRVLTPLLKCTTSRQIWTTLSPSMNTSQVLMFMSYSGVSLPPKSNQNSPLLIILETSS